MKGLKLLATVFLMNTLLILQGCFHDENDDVSDNATTCTPDIPIGEGLFTSAPASIDDVSSVIPLGSSHPGSNHVIPVNHNYLVYPATVSPGSISYPVYAMADGEIIYLFKQRKDGRPDLDYQVYIKHSCSVVAYYDHIHELNSDIQNYLDSNASEWTNLGGEDALLFLGQEGGPVTIPVTSGQLVGYTKDYSYDWDVGVIDSRRVSGFFIQPNANRYPSLDDMIKTLPFITADVSIYQLGNDSINASCFIDYLDDHTGLKSTWYAKIGSNPQECGRVGWDIPQRLRGTWFNPVIDSLIAPSFDSEIGALTIVPENFSPSTKVKLSWGVAAIASSNPEFALLDPANWIPAQDVSAQLRDGFRATMDHELTAVINPDPANVTVNTMVCYDLQVFNPTAGFNSILFIMSDSHTLNAKYDPTINLTAQCSNLLASNPAVSSDWVLYSR